MKQNQLWPIFNYPDIHSHVPGKNRVLSVDFENNDVDLPDDQAFTLGVHPWFADRVVDWEMFERNLVKPNIVGIGEAGLDTFKGPVQEVQLPVFERQIELAEKYRLPLIIHSVRSNHKILELKKRYSPEVPWVIHGFRGNLDQAQQLMAAGLHLSLGKLYNLEVVNLHHPLIHRETDELI